MRSYEQLSCLLKDWGIRVLVLRGYEGLVDPVEYMPLTPANTSGILTEGGTILGSTNRGRFSATTGEDNRLAIDPDLLSGVAQTVRQLDVCGLICIGGDGSLAIADQFHQFGIPVVGVRKPLITTLELRRLHLVLILLYRRRRML